MGTDFLLVALAPTVLPGLQRSLEVAFLAGLATGRKLSQGQASLERRRLPALPKRAAPAQVAPTPAAPGELPRAPPNDPERKGNIWHRYEHLEAATRQLQGANEALVAEKTRSLQDKRRLEDALLDVHAALQGSSPGPGAHAISSDTAQLLAELKRNPRLPRSPQRAGRPPAAAIPNVPATAEVSGAAAELRAELARAQDSAQRAEQGAAALQAQLAAVQGELAAMTAQLQEAHAARAAAEERLAGAERDGAVHVELQEQVSELEGQLQDLAEDRAQLRAQLQAAREAAAAAADAALLRSLEQQVQGLAQRNAQLEAAAKSGSAERVAELESAHAAVVAENARLQAKMLRLSGNAPAVAAAGELLAALKAENAALQCDNERLLSYVESLEATASGGANSGTPRGHRALLESYVALKADAQAAAEESERLRAELADLQRARGAVTTVPVPVRVEDGESVDPELWLALEEAQGRVRSLEAENTALRARTPPGTPLAPEAELAAENARLRRQLSVVMETRAAEINDDNLRLISQLTEENGSLEKENARLASCMAAGTKDGGRAVLQDILATNERLQKDKAQAMAKTTELARKNTQLIEESEAMLHRLNTSSGARPGSSSGEASPVNQRGDDAVAAKQPPRRGMFSFRRTSSKSASASSEADVGGQRGASSPAQVPGSPDVADLVRENSQLHAENERLAERARLVPDLATSNADLTAENLRLNDRMATLVKDLQEENRQLMAENERLNKSLEKVLADNTELSGRLIDVALEATAGSEAGHAGSAAVPLQKGRLASVPLGRWTQAEAQKRRSEAAAELAAVEERQAERAAQRSTLCRRASSELEAYEKHKSSAERAYEKSRALALQRLSSRNSQIAHVASPKRPTEGAGAAFPAGQPGRDLPGPSTPDAAEEGQFDEALRRRREGELSRAALQAKIEAFKMRQRSSLPRRAGEDDDDDDGDVADRAPAEAPPAQALSGADALRRESEDRVRAAFFRYAGNHNVSSFMKALGFELPARAHQDSPRGLIRAALQVVQPEAQKEAPPERRMLAEAARRNLLKWHA